MSSSTTLHYKDTSPKKTQPVSKKMKWTTEEDDLLVARITKFGTGNWSLIAQELQGRTGKQCRERWTNQLNPNLNRENWAVGEDRILLQQQQICGNSWSKIARFLPGRSSNSVKNRWSWLVRHRVMPNASAQQNQSQQILAKQQVALLQAQAIVPSKQKTMNFDPFGQESFEPLPLLLMASSGEAFIQEYDQPDFQPLEAFEKGLSLWDA